MILSMTCAGFFLLEHRARHLLPRDVNWIRCGDLHGDVLHELLEVLGAGDKVGLAIDLDQHADLAARVDIRMDQPILGLPMLLLGGVGQALLSQVLDRPLEVSLGRLEGRLAVHHTGSGHLPEFVYVLC